MNNIPWKYVPIENEVDGVKLKGEIKYWSKDWIVTLQEPFIASYSTHLMLMIPSKFVVEESQDSPTSEINILEKSIEKLKTLYLENKTNNAL